MRRARVCVQTSLAAGAPNQGSRGKCSIVASLPAFPSPPRHSVLQCHVYVFTCLGALWQRRCGFSSQHNASHALAQSHASPRSLAPKGMQRAIVHSTVAHAIPHTMPPYSLGRRRLSYAPPAHCSRCHPSYIPQMPPGRSSLIPLIGKARARP